MLTYFVCSSDSDDSIVVYNDCPWGGWWLCLSLTPFLHITSGKTQLCCWTVIVDKCSYLLCLFFSDFAFSNASTFCRSVLSDSSALDSQVKSHCTLPPCWCVIPCMYFLPLYLFLCLVVCNVMVFFFFQICIFFKPSPFVSVNMLIYFYR